MNNIVEKIDWEKVDGLIPVIIQNQQSLQVLMLGYMNSAAIKQTLSSGKVTFYSRTKKRLWIKGETSGQYLTVQNMELDCDQDTLLIQVIPKGNSCHLNQVSCFTKQEYPNWGVLSALEQKIEQRYKTPETDSYTQQLFKSGKKRIAQKVGEEGVEVALAALSDDKKEVKAESADLLYHLLVLLKACDLSLGDVVNELKRRSENL